MRFRTRRFTVFPTILLALLSAAPVAAQGPENVAVVINEASADSQKIGEHYIRARAIPSVNVVRIQTSTDDEIGRADYVRTIEAPIAGAIRRNSLQDRVLYIVLTKGVPLRIEGTGGLDGTVASVDSELTLLYRRLAGASAPVIGRVTNPYFLGATPLDGAQRFSHRLYDIYLVSRLDAFTVDEAIALIDRARAPSRDGRIVLDQRAGVHRDQAGDVWLAAAAQRLTEMGYGNRVVLEQTTVPARNVDNVLGYYSWGSNDPQNRVRRFDLRFVAGALAGTFVSSDARTLQEPPKTWVPSDQWNSSAGFRGSPQSLIGDLIREGASGVSGHVAEPFLQSTVRPEILFSAYLSGFNLIESFYLALPHLGWQTIVIGDPLCSPFPRALLTQADLDSPNDVHTELPAFFSARRLETMRASMKNRSPEAAPTLLKSESRLMRGDEAGAIRALEEATAMAPTLAGPQLLLASMYAKNGQRAQANDRFRTVLKSEPDNVVALNDLAYSLAVYENGLTEALPLARRAAQLAPNNPSVLDTAGWVEHLVGNDRDAVKLLADAVQRGPDHPEIRVHAAVAYAAVGDLAKAGVELSEALRLNPSLEQDPRVRQLREQLKPR